MTYASDDEIARIARGLIDRTLPKAEWTHAAHFAAALWLTARHGAETERLMPGLIRAYNEAVGGVNSDTSGYHETITLASLRAARSVLEAAPPGTPLWRVHETLMASALGRSDWLLAHWSKPLLFSPAARKTWTPPDLQALPF